MSKTRPKVNRKRNQKLIEHLRSVNIGQGLIAEILGVSQATISRRLSGIDLGFCDREIDILEGYLGIKFESCPGLEGLLIIRRENDLQLELVGKLKEFFVFFLEVPGSGKVEIKNLENHI